MNLRDRVKQTATATSDTEYVLTGGVAATGHLTFAAAFKLSTMQVGTHTYRNVPLLVQTDTDWQVVIADVVFVSGGSDTATISNGTVYGSSTGAALGLTGDAPVTITLSETVEHLGLLALGRPDPFTTDAEALPGIGVAFLRPLLTDGALMALGRGARAAAKNAVAIGAGAFANDEHAVALGDSIGPYRAGELAFGIGNADLGGGYGEQFVAASRGVMNAKTADATPTTMGLTDRDGVLLTGSGAMGCFAGLTHVKAVVSCVELATGDCARWDVEFAVNTHPSTWASAFFGTATITADPANAAGLSTADVDVTVDSVNNSASFEVTGVAAKTLLWACTYDAHHNEVY